MLAQGDSAESEIAFHNLRKKESPDVILTLYNDVHRLVGKEPTQRCCQRAAAVEMVIGMIHNHEIGIPDFPRATLIDSSWVEGNTTGTFPS